MGRRRLINRENEILERYRQGYPSSVICERFRIDRGNFGRIIRRAEKEGYKFGSIEQKEWDETPAGNQMLLFGGKP